MSDIKVSDDFKSEVSEDNLSARLSGGAIHLLADALVSCFKGSGAINHLECSFEDPDDSEQYKMLMQKKSGITQGDKIEQLQQENAELREMLGKHKQFNEDMHTMDARWTIDMSVALHRQTCELLNKNE